MKNSFTYRIPILLRRNIRMVKQLYPGLRGKDFLALRDITRALHLSISRGELVYIDGKWYVSNAGLLKVAHQRRCRGIRTSLEERFCEPGISRWVFKATVYRSLGCHGFVGYGDADPSNVSSLVHGAEMRVAETRAVNRALRKAYGIGLCSVEELGWTPRQPEPERQPNPGSSPSANGHNGHQRSQPRLRDRLCLLIRQHHLDAALVKAYAADYCETPTLRDASRESVEAFINRLAQDAVHDRDALLCRLNSYAKTEEAHS